MFRCVLWVFRTTLLVLSSPHPPPCKVIITVRLLWLKTLTYMCILIGISWVFPPTHSDPRPPESSRQMLCACTSNVCYEYEPLTNIHGWFCSSSLPWPSSTRIPLVMQSVSVVRRWLGDTIRLWRCWISTVLACPHQPSQVYVIPS